MERLTPQSESLNEINAESETPSASFAIPSIQNDVVSYHVTVKNDVDLENWMSNLPNKVTLMPIVYISIPGSHNSFTYCITHSSDVSSDCPETIQYLGQRGIFKLFSKRIILKWSKGQALNVTQQLQSGIRYFDIRLDSKNNSIRIAHGMCGNPIEGFLEEINSFLNTHPKEVVILDFQHFYKFSPSDHEKMKSMLSNIFKGKICLRKRKMKANTLSLFWRDNIQVLIIYRNPVTAVNNMYWPAGTWSTYWPNKIKLPELLEYLSNSLNVRKREIGHVSQGILTPTPKYIILHPFGNLKKLAKKVNSSILSWLDHKSNGMDGVNVVICDFVDAAFCRKVILINYK